MDNYRDHPSDFEPSPATVADSGDDIANAIGSDERRMHVRAYNYWVSLLGGRDYPSVEDLEPDDLADFSANSVLLDFTAGRDNPATPYIGTAVREECGLGEGIGSIADVPSRSLLSRLTDHYMQIIANRAPVGFEAEFVNQRGASICYRGILMPLSSDGDTIDFIYGVINWKQSEGSAAPAILVPQLAPVEPEPVAESDIIPDVDPFAVPHLVWEDGPLASDDGDDADADIPDVAVDADAGLADRLWAARETAEAVKSADGRSRVALYRALALAYDFAVAAEATPTDYAELLEESGVKAQARAPMTPIVKLVFGVDYDKTRLTEFAAALAFAQRSQVAAGSFQALIEGQAGGLKGLVAAERAARRPAGRPDSKGQQARAELRQAAPLTLDTLAGEAEFSLAVIRRRPDGGYAVVAIVEDGALTDRAILRTA